MQFNESRARKGICFVSGSARLKQKGERNGGSATPNSREFVEHRNKRIKEVIIQRRKTWTYTDQQIS
jgi:hypothetical protein